MARMNHEGVRKQLLSMAADERAADVTEATTSISSSRSNGFGRRPRCWSGPFNSASRPIASATYAVHTMTGVRRNAGSVLNDARTSHPLTSGITTSSMITIRLGVLEGGPEGDMRRIVRMAAPGS